MAISLTPASKLYRLLAESIYAPFSLPASYLINYQLPVRPPGPSSSVSHTVSSILEGQPSALPLYCSTEYIDKVLGSRPCLYDAMRMAINTGIPERESYNSYLLRNSPREEAQFVVGTPHRDEVRDIASISTIDCCKRALIVDGALGIVLPCYNYSSMPWRQGNTPDSNQLLFYEAMALIGYDSQGFILRSVLNRWSCDDGYLLYPYQDWGHHIEIWTYITNTSGRSPRIDSPVISSSSSSSPRSSDSSDRTRKRGCGCF